VFICVLTSTFTLFSLLLHTKLCDVLKFLQLQIHRRLGVCVWSQVHRTGQTRTRSAEADASRRLISSWVRRSTRTSGTWHWKATTRHLGTGSNSSTTDTPVLYYIILYYIILYYIILYYITKYNDMLLCHYYWYIMSFFIDTPQLSTSIATSYGLED